MEVLEKNQSKAGSQEVLEEKLSKACSVAERYQRVGLEKRQAVGSHAGFAICS